jgi:Tfp pilus assembly protein PilN
MITTINLLPPELRKKERTPMKALLPFLGCVAAVGAGAAFWAWLHFGELATARNIKTDLEAQSQSRKPQLDYVKNLRSEETEYTDRAKTITTIAASRMNWTRKMDELVRVMTDDHSGDRYLAWLRTMDVKPPNGAAKGKSQEGEQVTLKGLCFSSHNDETNALKRCNQLQEATNQSDFFRPDFVAMNNPTGRVEVLDDDLKPSNAWTLEMLMTMAARTVDPKKGTVVSEAGGPRKK